jgi:hypothetical protein
MTSDTLPGILCNESIPKRLFRTFPLPTSGLNYAALTLTAYTSPLRLLYTGKARFRARGLASPDGFRVSPPPQGHFQRISVRFPFLPSSTGLSWRDMSAPFKFQDQRVFLIYGERTSRRGDRCL